MENIIIRADASTEIGTGHIMRCLTLADEVLKISSANIIFLCRNLDGHLEELIKERGYCVYLIRTIQKEVSHWRLDWYEDSKQTIEIVKSIFEYTKLIIVDHYSLDHEWETQVSKSLNSKIMVIDDLIKRRHHADLLLDTMVDRKKDEYKDLINEKCQSLLGSQYCLLRKQFAELRSRSLKRKQRFPSSTIKIFVMLGGFTPLTIAEDIINSFSHIKNSIKNHEFEIDFVYGRNNTLLKNLKKKAEEKNVKINIHINSHSIAELMHVSDIAIGAGGGTSWERCCMGLPTFLLILADNQKESVKKLISKNAALFVDKENLTDSITHEIVALINNVEKYKAMSLNASRICDGAGAGRVANALLKLISKKDT